MIAWWWIPITIVVTGFFVLLALGMGKAAGDCDEWHDGFRAGMVWARHKRDHMEGNSNG